MHTSQAVVLYILAFATILSGFSNCLADEAKGEFFGVMQTEYPSWFKQSFLDFNDDIEEANSAGKRIIIFFHQPGCPYCNALVERNFAQKNIEEKVKKSFDVITINMWGDRTITYVDGKQYTEKSLAVALKVQFTPTVLLFNEKGEVVLRLNGYRSPQRFTVDLDYVAQHQETKTGYREYVKANMPAEASSKKMHSENFFNSPPYDLRRKSGSKAKNIAVFFEQKDCPNCDFMHTKILPDKELRSIIERFDNVQLDMWSKTELITPSGKKTSARQWAKDLDIKYAPSIVVFNEKGEEIIRSEAFFKVFHTQGIFNYVLSGEYKKEPSFQRYLTNYAEHIREKGKDVNIWRLSDE